MKKALLSLVGIAIFIFILLRLDLAQVYSIIISSDTTYLLLCLIFLIPTFFFKALRWNMIKKVQALNFSLTDSYIMYHAALFLGFVTPGRIGEFAKAMYLKQRGSSLGKSFLSVLLDRLFDLGFLVVIGYFSMLFFITHLETQFYITTIVLFLSLVMFSLLFYQKTIAKKIMSFIFKMLIPEKYKQAVKLNFYDFLNDLKLLNFKKYLQLSFITLLSLFLWYLTTYFLALAVGMDISFLNFIPTITMVGLVTLLPISFLGLGTRDLTLIFFLGFFSISAEKALALSMLLLAMNFFLSVVGLMCWFKKPISLK